MERGRNEGSIALEQKKSHGQSFNQTEVAGAEKRLWLRDGSIKRETESLIMAAQEQAIRTNAIKAKIDETQAESKCRLCAKVGETVRHIVYYALCWHKGSIKGGITWCAERCIGKYVEKLVLL